MTIINKQVESAINRKFIKPLKYGCQKNIIKLSNERRVKHDETIGLLSQAHETIINAESCIKGFKLIDANTLLRSSFEYIMMAMMIQFDESTYEEFTKLGLVERDKTRICELIGKFRTHLNKISEETFKDINRDEKLKMLNDLYDKLCNFTHSSIVVSTITEIKNKNEKEILQLLIYQNYYFFKMLLFFSINYFTNDKEHYVEPDNMSLSFLFMFIDIAEKSNKYSIDFSNYRDLLYYDKNTEYFEKNQTFANKISNEFKLFQNEIKENQDEFMKILSKFLK